MEPNAQQNPVQNSSGWPFLQRSIEKESPVPPAHPMFVRLAKRLIPGFQSPDPFALKTPLPPGIYIAIFHSIVDPQNRREWEQFYTKGETTTTIFAQQLDWFLDRMTPIRLSEAPNLLESGAPKKPYFVVTFDDGFENLLRNALPITQMRNIQPTVFVNAAFAAGEETFFRILAAILTATGGTKLLANALQSAIPDIVWDDDPVTLFNQTKTIYRPESMETVCQQVYHAHHGGNHRDLHVHLSVEEVRLLSQSGWEIANHTYAHRFLGTLDAQAVFSAIERNQNFWQEAGINLIPFLGFPIGRSQDVNDHVQQWLDLHPQVHGIFANRGINFAFCRKEWLRFGLGHAVGKQMASRLWREIIVTQQALATLNTTNHLRLCI